MPRFAAPIAEQIWDSKYRLKQADGTPIDLSVEDSWRRVARDLARVSELTPPCGRTAFTPRLRISNSCPPAASLPALAPGAR